MDHDREPVEHRSDLGSPTDADAYSHAPADSRSTGDPERTRRFALECARLFADDKCEHIVVLDVRGRSQVTDYVVVASGTSDRQMASAIDDAVELGGEQGFPAVRTNRDTRSTWLLADFVDVIAHLFEPNTRAFYDIEMLWGDAPRVDWRRPGDPRRDGTDG
jgi:ribosome-associated protein